MADSSGAPDHTIEERRRHPAPTQITVQQPLNNGLGKFGSAANLTAVGAILVLLFWMYRDMNINARDRDIMMRDYIKERDVMMRDEIRLSREANAGDARLMSQAVQSLTNSNISMASEFRSSRISLEARIDKILGIPRPEKPCPIDD